MSSLWPSFVTWGTIVWRFWHHWQIAKTWLVHVSFLMLMLVSWHDAQWHQNSHICQIHVLFDSYIFWSKVKSRKEKTQRNVCSQCLKAKQQNASNVAVMRVWRVHVIWIWKTCPQGYSDWLKSEDLQLRAIRLHKWCVLRMSLWSRSLTFCLTLTLGIGQLATGMGNLGSSGTSRFHSMFAVCFFVWAIVPS